MNFSSGLTSPEVLRDTFQQILINHDAAYRRAALKVGAYCKTHRSPGDTAGRSYIGGRRLNLRGPIMIRRAGASENELHEQGPLCLVIVARRCLYYTNKARLKQIVCCPWVPGVIGIALHDRSHTPPSSDVLICSVYI